MVEEIVDAADVPLGENFVFGLLRKLQLQTDQRKTSAQNFGKLVKFGVGPVVIRRFASFHFEFVQIVFGRGRAFLEFDDARRLNFPVGFHGEGVRHEGERRSVRRRTGRIGRIAEMRETVNQIVPSRPGRVQTVDDQSGEARDTFRVGQRRAEPIVDESHGVVIQIRHVQRTQMREEKKNARRILSQGFVSVATEIDETRHRVFHCAAFGHHVEHLFGEDERRSIPEERRRFAARIVSSLDLPIERTEFLRVAEIFAEIDVKQVSGFLHHDVLVVPIADAQNVRRHAVRGARIRQVVDRHAQISFGVVMRFQPEIQRRVAERAFDRSQTPFDVHHRFAFVDHFHETTTFLNLNDVEKAQTVIEQTRLPNAVHPGEQL